MTNTYFESKDARRIADILTKSKGQAHKAIQFASNMAKAITKSDKALRRAAAADAAGQHQLAAIFYVRYGQLSIGR